MDEKYYLGLDVGTDSCGWAVTDLNYNIKRFKGNSMWGVRRFDGSQTAESRRGFRTARRRYDRRRARLDWLEEIFAEEIGKVDPSFFIRLSESNLHIEDKSTGDKYALFSGAYTDKDFHKAYPNIFSLRRDLIENTQAHDVRLVFMALHHMIKYRGHFLFEELRAEDVDDFEVIFESLAQYCIDNYEEIDFTTQKIDEVELIIRNRNLGKKAKKDALEKIYNITKKTHPQMDACLSLVSGGSVKMADIFEDESLNDAEKNSISFSEKYLENEDAYRSTLGERFELIEHLKAVYDWSILANILQGKKYISVAHDMQFQQHKQDLQSLKAFIKEYKPEVYNEVFKTSKDKLKNYVAYSGHSKKNGRTDVLHTVATQSEFCDYLKKTLGQCANSKYAEMFERIEAHTFCPKQRNANNSVIPMQLHRVELIKILDNAEGYLPFLSVADENGITAKQKIIDIFDYKIPYYVGPLNNHSGKYWVKRTDGKVYPWNIREIVDFDASAEAFIENLTNKCTYLTQRDVLPKNSILFSKFNVLNAINPLKIDGKPISVKLKQEIYHELFLKRNKVTKKARVVKPKHQNNHRYPGLRVV